MEQENKIRLLLRQLRDIQSQAEKIVNGEKSDEAIESFARYSVDLKTYISKNIEEERIKNYTAEIPNIDYSRTRVQLWQYLILPIWWISLYKDYMARNKTVEEIIYVRSKYAHLELLVRGLIN